MAGNSSWPKLCRAGVKDRGRLSNSNIQAIAHPNILERRHYQGLENQEERNSFPIPKEQTDSTNLKGKGNVEDSQ